MTRLETAQNSVHPLIRQWFDDQGWELFDFQCEAIIPYQQGRSGLIHAPTGFSCGCDVSDACVSVCAGAGGAAGRVLRDDDPSYDEDDDLDDSRAGEPVEERVGAFVNRG